MKLKILLILLYLCLFTSIVRASSDLPKNLNSSDQKRALEILGLGTTVKVLDDPSPLGEDMGLEVGITTEFIPLEDLVKLGNKTKDSGDFNYYTFTLGKGLYNNVDFFLYFSPPSQSEKMQNFGSQVRWGMFQMQKFPLTLTFVGYFGGANFDNLINVTTTGFDLVSTFSLDNMALYCGVGRVRAKGQFLGGTGGITSTGENETQSLDEGHSLFGLNIDIQKYFFALEMNHYADTVLGAKLGYRF